MSPQSTMIRVFFGVPVIYKDIEFFDQLILKSNPNLESQVRWTKAGNHHITVCFIGDVDTKAIDLMIAAIKRSLTGFKIFSVTVNQLYHFPKQSSNLVAAYVDKNNQIQKLYDKIESALVELDYPAEKRAYQPHITLFRSKHGSKIHILPVQVDQYELPVNEVVLYKSVLGQQGGSVYQPIHRFKLQS